MELPEPLLRGLSPQDVPFLFHIASMYPETWSRVCLQGTPTPSTFESAVSQQVLAQYMVDVSVRDACHTIGLVSLYEPDFVAGTMWVESVGLDGDHHIAVRDRALSLIISRAFEAWPTRKVYGVHHSYEAPVFAGLGGVDTCEEVRLTGVTLHEGAYWDRIITSIRRENWMRHNSLVEAPS